MIRRKKLPTNKHEGLCVSCSSCKKYFAWTKDIKDKKGKIVKAEPTCGESKVKYSKCKSFHKHKYAARFHRPGNNGSIAKKTFETNKYNEAVELTIKFKRDLHNQIKTVKTRKNNSVIYLFNSQIEYLDFLNNIGVPEHLKIERSDNHIKEQYKCLTLFNESLKVHNINKKTIPVHKISDIHVGFFHKYLLENKSYENKTYNNKMGALKSFFEWVIKHHKIKNDNPFAKVKLRSVKSKKEIITGTEFRRLLDQITEENGHVIIGNKRKYKRNLYRNYLSSGIQLCLHTGGRREEVVELRWNMIHELKGDLAYIEFNNLKVERILGDGFNDNVDTNIIPITKDLKKLLFKLGYDKNKNTNNYIICPDRSTQSTKTIMDNLSKGFSHYYKQLNTGRELQMKCLRKTYLTHLNRVLKGDTIKLSSHTSEAVIKKHYIDERVIPSDISNMVLFED